MTNTLPLPRRRQAGYRFASAWVLGLALVGTGVLRLAGGDGFVFAQAPNPCALLTVGEIQPLAAKANVPDGVPSSLEAFGSVTCRYAWGAGVGRSTLDVTVNEASRMFPGLSPDQMKERLLQSVRNGTSDAVIADIGEVAVFKSDSPFYVTATASIRGRVLEVHLDGWDAREKKDDVIALLKSAVSRL
jgi:hypothetical protein